MPALRKLKPALERHARFSCRLDALADAMVAADAAAGAPDLTPKWVQVATAGDYKGYAGGAFVFDDKIFAQIIANFRAHPAYLATNGVGSADVIPWDFNHASASFAADGSIPVSGTPAQGWIQELKMMPGATGTQLWALTNWLEPARTYILQNKYKWASVVVGFDCRDQKTNTNIGAVLESVALTNNPFIEGMQKLVADRSGGANMPGQRATLEWYGRTASDPEDAFCCLRDMFGLPQTADVGSVLAELMKLQTWATGGGAPIGVDLDQLVANVRTIFNMPALSTVEEVFTETSKLLGALLQQQALDQLETETPPAPAAAPESPPAAGQLENRDMSILKIIASRLGVQETEQAAAQALEGLFSIRAMLAKLVGQPEHSTDKVLLDAAAGQGDARTKLGALLAALGIEDSGAAVEKIAGLMKQASELEAAMPELKSLREAAAATEEKAAEEDVAKVANSLGINDNGVKLALTMMRKSDKKAFCTQYAVALAAAPAASAPAAPAQQPGHAYLTTNISGAAGGAERTVTTNPDGSVALSAPAAGAKGGAPTGGKVRVDLSKYPGANRTLRLHAHVKATVPGADKFTLEQLMVAGMELANTTEFIG
jgi:hypothetical protein